MCPISTALEMLGDKWALIILRDMIFRGMQTYSEFLKAHEKIATNTLANRLMNLEQNGLIEKKDYPGNKVKVLYKLTPMGLDLIPVLLELVLWGDKYFETDADAKSLADNIRSDRVGLIKYLREKHQ
jgi:DNA-binding HxlR family transcriptional regulator